MLQVGFILGEERYIRLLIKSIDENKEFIIRQADYRLVTQAGVEETSGHCTIADHMIMALISPLTRGRYKVIFSYYISDECLIEVVETVVM